MPTTTAFPQNRRARGVAIQPIHENKGVAGTRFRPSSIAVIGQGAVAKETYSTTKERVFTAKYVGDNWGYESTLYQMVESLLPANGAGVGDIPVNIYPMVVATEVPAQSVGDITPSGGPAVKSERHYVKINNRWSHPIDIVAGDEIADFCDKGVVAINGVVGMPGTAADGTTKIDFTVGWEGANGDDVYIEMVSPSDSAFSCPVTQPTGGAGTLSITEALAQIGEAEETLIVSALQYTDDTILDEYEAWGLGRWDPQVRKYANVFTGTSEAALATVTAVTDARKATDKVNVICPNPGSHDLPCKIAAEFAREVAILANEDPAHDYCGRKLTGLTPGTDAEQWSSPQRQAAVTAGCSTVEVVDGVVQISDTVTCYHPTGEDPPAYAYVCDIAKLATIKHEFDLEFNSSKWSGVPLIPDGQATRNRTAKKPMHARAAAARIYKNAALDAILADPDYAIENTKADIGATNPKRLDVQAVFKLAGNANVISIDMLWSFNYGGGQ